MLDYNIATGRVRNALQVLKAEEGVGLPWETESYHVV